LFILILLYWLPADGDGSPAGAAIYILTQIQPKARAIL
jgi:hypothetical protein